MAAPSVGSLEFLTRRHGVKVDSAVSVEECVLAVGAVVGIENVLSASRMNNAVVLFLKTIEFANLLVENGIEVGGIFTLVLPLSTPSKKVMLSNVPPFIKNETLAAMLARYGKLVSPVKMIPIGSKSPHLKHVMSFRRTVYMILKDNADELDVTLNFRFDDFNYVIYVTTNVMKCFGCGENGHFARACPRKTNELNKAVSVVIENARTKQNDVTAVAVEMPGPSTANKAVLAVTENVRIVLNDDVTVAAERPGPSVMPAAQGNPLNIPDDVEIGRVAAAGVKDATNAPRIDQATVDSIVSENSNGEDEAMAVDILNPDLETSVMEDKVSFFKTPQKRLLMCQSGRQSKRSHDTGVSQTDTDSESDISVCSFSSSLPLSGYSSRNYTVDDIKSFLRVTKNLRKVKLEEYFPDITQFIEKVKSFKRESCFTNKEGYRLNKILTKLKSQPDGLDDTS